MNALPTVTITLVYLLPVVLLALLLIGRRRRHPAWLLTIVLIALPAFYIGHYLMLQQLKGWPSDTELPQRFHLLAFDIIEPDPNAADPGRILLWIQGVGEKNPRVHAQPYRKQLHQTLVAAGKRRQQGYQQIGSKAPKGSTASMPERQAEQVIRFEDAITKPLPSKR